MYVRDVTNYLYTSCTSITIHSENFSRNSQRQHRYLKRLPFNLKKVLITDLFKLLHYMEHV